MICKAKQSHSLVGVLGSGQAGARAAASTAGNHALGGTHHLADKTSGMNMDPVSKNQRPFGRRASFVINDPT